MLLGKLADSILVNAIQVKGVIKTGKAVIRTRQNF